MAPSSSIPSWKGKMFGRSLGGVRNRILPVGLPAIVAKVHRGPSWVDDGECVILDCSGREAEVGDPLPGVAVT